MDSNEQKIAEIVGDACAKISGSMAGIEIDPIMVLLAAAAVGIPPIASK